MCAACRLILYILRQRWLTFRACRNDAAPLLRSVPLLSCTSTAAALDATLKAVATCSACGLGPAGSRRHAHAFVWSGDMGWASHLSHASCVWSVTLLGADAAGATDAHYEWAGGEQLEQDTDRDRYMSPIETKQYGLIDHVIGGDDAGFKFTVPPLPPSLGVFFPCQPARAAPAL